MLAKYYNHSAVNKLEPYFLMNLINLLKSDGITFSLVTILNQQYNFIQKDDGTGKRL